MLYPNKKQLQVIYPESTIFPVLVVVDVPTSGIQPTSKLLYYRKLKMLLNIMHNFRTVFDNIGALEFRYMEYLNYA